MDTIYDISVKTVDGEEKLLREYEGKVMLIVNTASKCGFTPQFKQLQMLYEQFDNRNFTILGFPCSQFANQEFSSTSEAVQFCQMNYGVTFPMFAKIKVNGKNEHPLYTFLKNHQFGLISKNIKWNFTKFLINQKGKVIDRFSPMTDPMKIKSHIERLL